MRVEKVWFRFEIDTCFTLISGKSFSINNECLKRYVEDRVTLRPVGGDLNICLCNPVLAPPKAFRRCDNWDVESSSVCAVLNASFSSRELHRKGFAPARRQYACEGCLDPS